jgi:hypothetical protein
MLSLLLFALWIGPVVLPSVGKGFDAQRFALQFLSSTAPADVEYDQDMAEIGTYYPDKRTIYVANDQAQGIDVIDISDPFNPVRHPSILLGGAPSSVTILNDVLAVAMVNDDEVTLIDLHNHQIMVKLPTGFQPDSVRGSNNNKYLLAACEGEPESDYSVDPEGSVWVYTLQNPAGEMLEFTVQGVASTKNTISIRELSFTQFNNVNLDPTVRIFGPGSTVAQDVEPEYIAFSPDDSYAWVCLQENNAIAKIDLNTLEIVSINGIPYYDRSQVGQGMDPTNDNQIKIGTWPVLGMALPDSIFTFEQDGKFYLVSADEGDFRAYDAFDETSKVKDLTLDPVVFPNWQELQLKTNLGGLSVSQVGADPDSDGDVDQLYSFGGRGFSLFEITGGEFVHLYSSGGSFEQILKAVVPNYFNFNDDSNDSFDQRSQKSGAEPAGIYYQRYHGVPLLFVGLERISGFLMFDLTDITKPRFLQYATNRNFSVPFDEENLENFSLVGDLHTEQVFVISENDSPLKGTPIVVTTNPVSGTTSLWAVIDLTEQEKEEHLLNPLMISLVVVGGIAILLGIICVVLLVTRRSYRLVDAVEE